MGKKFYKEDNEAIPSVVFAESQPNGFSEITDAQELNDLFRYRLRDMKKAGIEFVEVFSIETFGEKYRDDELTAENIDYILNKVNRVLCYLSNGFLEQALYYVSYNIGPTVTAEDIMQGYTQEIHDKLENDLNTLLLDF